MKIQKRIMVLRTIEVDDTDPTFCGTSCPLRGTEDCPRREADLQEDLFGSGKEYRGKECEKEFGLGPGGGAGIRALLPRRGTDYSRTLKNLLTS